MKILQLGKTLTSHERKRQLTLKAAQTVALSKHSQDNRISGFKCAARKRLAAIKSKTAKTLSVENEALQRFQDFTTVAYTDEEFLAEYESLRYEIAASPEFKSNKKLRETSK